MAQAQLRVLPSARNTVMVVDDQSTGRAILEQVIRSLDERVAVEGFARPVDAVVWATRNVSDLVLVDYMMPEMGGFEATRIIRERQKQPAAFPNYKSPLIIVAMTANAMQGDREQCLAAGMDDYIAKPVRLEDVRAIVERWGTTAGRSEATETTPAAAAAVATPAPAPPVETLASAPVEAPVDLERLHEFSDGSPENLRELITLYVNQTAEQLEQLAGAVQGAKAADVRRLAHSCAGASATCGMRNLVPLLRELERQGLEGSLTNAAELCASAKREFQRIREFLDDYMARASDLAART